MIDVVWIWTTHKACTLYVGGNRTHRHNPNVFNPYACLLTIRYLPFCIHINSRCPPTSADIVNRTRTTFLLDSLASYWNTFIPYRHAPWQHWLSPRIAFCTSRLRSATNTTKSARLGIEPTTNQLIADCSTTELHAVKQSWANSSV